MIEGVLLDEYLQNIEPVLDSDTYISLFIQREQQYIDQLFRVIFLNITTKKENEIIDEVYVPIRAVSMYRKETNKNLEKRFKPNNRGERFKPEVEDLKSILGLNQKEEIFQYFDSSNKEKKIIGYELFNNDFINILDAVSQYINAAHLTNSDSEKNLKKIGIREFDPDAWKDIQNIMAVSRTRFSKYEIGPSRFLN